MVRVARERIGDLFSLAEAEWRRGHPGLSNRYVGLARRVGTRYNIRIPSEYRELYCRNCSSYWAEGRTVRTRLRPSHRVRTCLLCGAARRVPTKPRRLPRGADLSAPSERRAAQAVFAAEPIEAPEEDSELEMQDDE